MRRNGKRVPLRDEQRQLAWLTRKGADCGFVVATDTAGAPDVQINKLPVARSRRGKTEMTIEAVRFDGRLVVTDPDKCWAAIGAGIGPAKAYGCGLLSLGKP